jgi:AcrR family transcriptional regulator
MNGGAGTREQILAAALRLFARKGYDHTGMEEIAKEVGITKPAIYHYFESKERLFVTLIELAHAEQDRLMSDLAARRLPLSQLVTELFRTGSLYLRENPDWSHLMLQIQSFPGALASFLDFHEHHEKDVAALSRIMEDATGDLRLRPGVTMPILADFFHWLFFAYWTRCVFLGEIPEDEQTARRMSDVLLFGAFEQPA